MKNSFIFVVCGAREHIDTLHFSLEYLKKYTSNEIWVLTDISRNEIPVIHDKVVDVRTSEAFNHHQASIFLKTGIHHYFPKGNRYCYLDTDILALSEEVDDVFNEFVSPISFAPDHCTMEQFSAYAVNCDCISLYDTYSNRIEKNLVAIDPLRTSSKPSIIENRKKLVSFYQQNNSIPRKIAVGLRFLFSFNRFSIPQGIYFDKKDKTWKDQTGESFMHHFRWAEISKKSGLKWNHLKGYPALPDGRSLWKLSCNHLKEQIAETFDIAVKNDHFQHWNGGVFLFDDSSHDFLNMWHESTLEIFKNPRWKTRDQGTLIKTVWQFGLQEHPTLNKKWNLIADYHNPFLRWEGNVVHIGAQESYTPALLHVYHHFGDETWDFWNTIPTVN